MFPVHKLRPHHEVAPEYPKYREYFTICTVRNPFARLVSQYWHVCDPTRIPPGADDFRKSLTREANDTGFVTYIQKWAEQPITGLIQQARIDYVIRMEAYVADIRRLPLPGLEGAKIPHEHNSRKKNWAEYYRGQDDMVRWVQEKYADDFKLFGYNPEFPGQMSPTRKFI